MKKTISCLIAVLLILCLAACGNNAKTELESTNAPEVSEETETVTASDSTAETESVTTSDSTEEKNGTLIVYFSATGTTKGVAEKIAALTGGDLYEIVPAEPYSDADLDWNDSSSRTTIEQNDKSVRPGIGSEQIDLTGYTTVYIGFPIWWGEEPRILDTFVESYSFDGITMIPFCTSSSSGIGRSGSNMEELAGSGTWLDGMRFSGDVSEDELQSWIDGLQ